jgi:hypothetical protein
VTLTDVTAVQRSDLKDFLLRMSDQKIGRRNSSMSNWPSTGDGRPNGDTGDEAAATKDELGHDAASLSAARSEETARQTAPVASQPVPQPVKRVKRPAKPAETETKPAAGAKKPFRMSYDGVANADYITYMITRGAR